MPRKTPRDPHRRAAADLASMRPRPDAAENPTPAPATPAGTPGFNEAAARCRGKPRIRVKSAGDARCFNEAAARCRGKPLEVLGQAMAAAPLQ